MFVSVWNRALELVVRTYPVGRVDLRVGVEIWKLELHPGVRFIASGSLLLVVVGVRVIMLQMKVFANTARCGKTTGVIVGECDLLLLFSVMMSFCSGVGETFGVGFLHLL